MISCLDICHGWGDTHVFFSQFSNVCFWLMTNQISLWGVRWKQNSLSFMVCSRLLWSPLPYILLAPVTFGSNTKLGNTLTSPRAVPWRKKTLTGISGCFLFASGCPAVEVQAFLSFTAPWSSFEGSWFGDTLTCNQVEILTRVGLQN